MTQALTTYQPQAISSVPFAECQNWAAAFAQSGLFTDVQGAAQCLVKVAAGAELGMPPFAAMNGIHIINKKLSLGGGLIAAVIKRSGHYTYRVKKSDAQECLIHFFERVDGKWEELGPYSFTIEEAKQAGLVGNATWTKYPKAMLFNRAIAGGARMHCPDIFGGPVYTPEELGATVDEEGNPVEVVPAATLRMVKSETVETEANTAEEKPTKPDTFRKELVGVAVKAFKEAGIIATLQNVASTLFIEPGEAETRYWSKGKFGFSNMNDEDVYRLAHYAKSGNALPQDAPVAEMLDELRAKLTQAP